MNRIVITILMVLILAPANLLALEISKPYTGIRPLGMGGAFSAVSNDENALFYNPAGLDRIEKMSFAVVNPYIKLSDAGIDAAEDFSDADMDNTSEVADVLRKHLGENINLQAALMPYFAKKRFALAVLAQANTNFEARNAAFPEMKIDSTVSGSGHVGYGHSFLDDKLRVGAAVKYISATGISEIYTAADIASDNFEDQIEDDTLDGSGVGFDLGAMYTFPVAFSPTVALTINDVADTDLGDAGEVPQTITLGAATNFKLWMFDLTGAIDWRDISNELGEDEDKWKRVHMGLEAKLPMLLTLRAGINQGYTTFGAGVNFKLVKLEYASYAEEIGSFAGQKADRRHVVQLSLGWF